jgi:hypothetical protein
LLHNNNTLIRTHAADGGPANRYMRDQRIHDRESTDQRTSRSFGF